MGAVARGVKENGGFVMGISPDFISEFEDIFDCDNKVMVDTMAERKTLMEKHADVFFIAPGGIGTMDEFFQVLTLKYLKRIDVPIVVEGKEYRMTCVSMGNPHAVVFMDDVENLAIEKIGIHFL